MSSCADKLQTIMLNLLHDAHPGMVRVKALTRSYVWWLGIDKALEHTVQICHPSQQTHNESLHQLLAMALLEIPMDIAVSFLAHLWAHSKDKMWLTRVLTIVDNYSKWPEVTPVMSTTATSVPGQIQGLCLIFAHWGWPEQLTSHNGSQFMSKEFAKSSHSNGIRTVQDALNLMVL